MVTIAKFLVKEKSHLNDIFQEPIQNQINDISIYICFTDNTSKAVSTGHNLCTGNKTEQLGYSSILLGMYHAAVGLVIVAAVMVMFYIALFLFAKR